MSERTKWGRALAAVTLMVAMAGCGGSTSESAVDANRQFALGERYARGEGVAFDLERARAAYRAACDAGLARACASLGYTLVIGPPGGRNLAEALSLTRAACRGGDLLGCTNQGFAMASGTPRDEAAETALHQRACDGGELVGCRRLALAYEGGVGVVEDLDRATTLYRRGCDGGDGRSCALLAGLYTIGNGVARDDAAAARLYRQGCDLGDGLGCGGLGFLHARGRGVDADRPRAVELYRQSCDRGEAVGCNNLGSAYARGFGLAVDHVRAVEFYRRACDYGSAPSCNSLGVAYRLGEGLRADVVRAAALFEQACEAGDGYGCANLAELYVAGEGVARDQDRAYALYALACSRGFDNACGQVEEGTEAEADARELAELTTKCEAEGDREACEEVGDAYGMGAGVDVDAERALEFFRMACGDDTAVLSACVSAAELLTDVGDDDDRAEAVQLLERSCEGGETGGCIELGNRLLNATGVPRDATRARALFERACTAGNDTGCIYFARLLTDTARDVEAGLARAPRGTTVRQLYAAACEARPGSAGCFQSDVLEGRLQDQHQVFRVQLTAVSGAPRWLRVGQRCEIVVHRPGHARSTFIRATCNRKPIYPTASQLHWTEPTRLLDDQSTEGDGDARLSLDTSRGTFTLADDASGFLGALQLTGRLSAEATR